MSQVVSVRYHHEGSSWWAESPELEGFVAVGSSLPEVRELVHEGVPFYADNEHVEILEAHEKDAVVVQVNVTRAPFGQDWNLSQKPSTSAPDTNLLKTHQSPRVPSWA